MDGSSCTIANVTTKDSEEGPILDFVTIKTEYRRTRGITACDALVVSADALARHTSAIEPEGICRVGLIPLWSSRVQIHPRTVGERDACFDGIGIPAMTSPGQPAMTFHAGMREFSGRSVFVGSTGPKRAYSKLVGQAVSTHECGRLNG